MASSISRRTGAARPVARPALGAVAVLMLVMSVGTPRAHADGTAVAPDPEARQAAQTRLVEGVDLLRRGQFAAALTKFDEAYAFVPSPNIHYDRALAYVGLARDADAMEAFDAFLAAADHAPPGTREKAERQRLTLRAHVAILEVFTDIPGAQVTLDGRRRGATPLDRSLYVDPGLHEVSVRNPATGATASERVAAAAGKNLAVTLRLIGPAARVAGAGQVIPPAGLSTAPAAAAATAEEQTPAKTTDRAVQTEAHTEPQIEARDTGAAHDRSAASLWALSAATLGVALLGAGGTFGVLAQRESDSLTKDSQSSTPVRRPPFDQAKETNGLRYQSAEGVCLAVGAVALATGVVLYAVGRRNERLTAKAGVAVRAAPSVTRTFAGAGVQLSF